MSHFMCGAAKACITPEQALLGDLRGLMDQVFGGVLDELYVRVIALQNQAQQALLISFDLDKIPRPARLIARITEVTGITEEYITITAIHTHSAPITGDRPDEGPNNLLNKPEHVQSATHQYEDYLEQIMLGTVRTAVARLQPARMGFGTGSGYINVGRKQWYVSEPGAEIPFCKCMLGVNAATAIDRTITVLKFEDITGETIAYHINYPVHCCVLHRNRCCDGKLGISGDIAGFVSRGLEERESGCVAIWCSGAAGDINPVMQLEVYYPNCDTGAMETALIEHGGSEILTMVASRHLAEVKAVCRAVCCTTDAVSLSGAVEWSKTPGKAEGTTYEVRLHMLKIGSAVLLGASGELYSSYAELLRDILPAEPLIVMNHESSLYARSGYILDDETLLLPDAELPGLSHTNMRPGYFMESFVKHGLSMYHKCFSPSERSC